VSTHVKETAVGPPIVAADAAVAQHSQSLKKNALGVWEIAYFVIAASAPVFVVVGVAWTAYLLGGIGAPMGYLVAGIFLMFFAVSFTAMSKYIKNAGAFYAYITRGLGKPIGVGAALVALFSYSIMSIGFYGAFAYYAQSTFDDLVGVNIPWQAWVFLGIAILAVVGHRDVNLGARLLLIFLTAEIVILALLSIAVIIQEPGNMSAQPFALGNFFVPGIGAFLVFGFGAFTGFESTAIYSEEARNPEKTIPRATYLAVGFLALFYAFTVWIATVAFGLEGVMKMALGDTASDMYFTMSDQFLGYWSLVVMRILIVTSIVACTIGFHNAVSRYGFALGRERLLPKALGRSHPKHGSPYVASAVQIVLAIIVVLVTIVLGGDPYMHLFVWTYAPGVVGLVLCQCLCVLAVLGFFWGDRRGHSALRVVISPIIGAIGLAGSFYLILTNFELLSGYTDLTSNLPFILCIPVVFIIGVIIAYWMKRKDPEHYAVLAADIVEVDVDALDQIEEWQDPQRWTKQT
jgi:amino acid transporter